MCSQRQAVEWYSHEPRHFSGHWTLEESMIDSHPLTSNPTPRERNGPSRHPHCSPVKLPSDSCPHDSKNKQMLFYAPKQQKFVVICCSSHGEVAHTTRTLVGTNGRYSFQDLGKVPDSSPTLSILKSLASTVRGTQGPHFHQAHTFLWHFYQAISKLPPPTKLLQKNNSLWGLWTS